jgi:hypothetical protein
MIQKQYKQRHGSSLMEVIAGISLMTILMVPMTGLLTASGRIWRQFESGHGSVAARQATIQEIGLRLDGAVRVLSTTRTQIRFRAKAGDNQRLFQRGTQIFWEHAGQTDLVGEGVGTLRFRQVARGTNPIQGELVEIQLQNAAGSNVSNLQSTYLVWIKPIVS